MNKVVLTGRLVRDAELSYIASTSTPKMSFSIAVERNYQKDKNNKKVDFINCEMIGKHTENLCQYVTKGKQILFSCLHLSPKTSSTPGVITYPLNHWNFLLFLSSALL